MLFHWFKHWLSDLAAHTGAARRHAKRPKKISHYVHLHLEALEDRIAPATITWANLFAGGDWDTASNWSGGKVPGPNDDVMIPMLLVPGATITHTKNIAETVHSIKDMGTPLNFSAGSLTLAGTMASPSTSTISGPLTFSGGGILQLTSDGNVVEPPITTLTLSGGGSVTGSEVLPQFDTKLTFGGGTFTLDSSSGITGGGAVDFAAGTVTDNGGYDVDSNNSSTSIEGTATFNGPVDNMGPLSITGTATLNANATVPSLSLAGNTMSGVLAGTGTVTVEGSGGLTWTGGTMTGSGTTLVYTGTNHTINGTLGEYLLGGRTLEIRNAVVSWNGGTLTTGGGAKLVTDTGGGEFDDATDASLTTSAGAALTITNDGTFKKVAGNPSTPQSIAAVFNNYNSVVVNAGNLELSGGGTFSGTNSITMVGQGAELTFASGSYLFMPGNLGTGGEIIGMGGVTFGGGSGTLSAEVDGEVAPSGGVSILSNAFVDGSGQLSGVTNGGTLEPGTSTMTGILAINGNYIQTAGGTLEFAIGGTTPGTQFDQLVVNGDATLSGTLIVTLTDGFVPAPGDTFTVMTYNSETGNLTTFIPTPPLTMESTTATAVFAS